MRGLELKNEVLSILKRIGALRKGSFMLHMGNVSEYYLDLRILPSYPEDFDKVVEAYRFLIEENKIVMDRVVGASHGAAPLTVAVSLKLGKPYALVKKIESENSFREPLLGEVRENERVLLLDDVASTGVTLACMTAIVRAKGAIAEDAAVLVDRELGAERLLSSFNVRLHSLLKFRELL